MNVLALLLNLIIPGVGSFVIGKAGQGVGQIIIWGIGFILMLTAILAIIGIPMMLGAWIWGIVTVVGSGNSANPNITIIQQTGPSNNVGSETPTVTQNGDMIEDKRN